MVRYAAILVKSLRSISLVVVAAQPSSNAAITIALNGEARKIFYFIAIQSMAPVAPQHQAEQDL